MGGAELEAVGFAFEIVGECQRKAERRKPWRSRRGAANITVVVVEQRERGGQLRTELRAVSDLVRNQLLGVEVASTVEDALRERRRQ